MLYAGSAYRQIFLQALLPFVLLSQKHGALLPFALLSQKHGAVLFSKFLSGRALYAGLM